MLDWGVGKIEGPALGAGIGGIWAQICAPLKASVIPMGSPGAEPGTLVLGLGQGGKLVLHFAGDLPGRDFSPYPRLPPPACLGLEEVSPSTQRKLSPLWEWGLGEMVREKLQGTVAAGTLEGDSGQPSFNYLKGLVLEAGRSIGASWLY